MYKTIPFLLLVFTASLHAADAGPGRALTEEDSKTRTAIVNALAGNTANCDASTITVQEVEKEQKMSVALDDWEKGLENAYKAVRLLKGLEPELQAHVLSFLERDSVKLKFLAHNMQKLIPAVLSNIHSGTLRALEHAQNQCSRRDYPGRCVYSTSGYFFGSDNHWFKLHPRELHRINPVHMRGKINCFTAQSSPSGEVIFKVCPPKFKELYDLNTNQLVFVASLWDQYQSNGHRLVLTQDQQVLFGQLPEEARDNLTPNYGLPAPVAPAPDAEDDADVDVPAAPLAPIVHLPIVPPAAAAAVDAGEDPEFVLDE